MEIIRMETRLQGYGKWLDRKIRVYMAMHDCSYEQAYRHILQEDDAAVREYVDLDTYTTKGPSIPSATRPQHEAGLKLHELIMAFLIEHYEPSYYKAMQKAMQQVL